MVARPSYTISLAFAKEAVEQVAPALVSDKVYRSPCGKMFPVRVLVESVRAQHCLSCAHDGHLLLDSYAVVSGHTLLSQLVDTVLSALGLSQLAVHSKGG